MVVGTGRIIFRLYYCNSLKEKRKIVKSIIQRIKNKFNISIAETGHNDTLSLAEIGFSLTGNDRRKINSQIDKVFSMADSLNLAEIIDTRMEILSW